ncbi:type I phosphodiesterase/nucleotide pyrophosphatase/phosphate transferase [Gonapodya prolifera JEL478]|uniref:Type I phosphodiesterase/nucleotide pyrophosphatase/phosphate transferase n=1 Tax=Gonapodya prolifera (strain JEL478) TaxID=1344416 RepID=A0A139A6C3_GONPJ|nr:type I phosphodiesterase/nucleotide pyrophosphatase/phosphate transferase [Gonapodya prolifera JEL478]|eukprot:KXS11995.1 type I phosphodiesterase/nucleotide pyrophosphatase/phosphate transferase [Gonapodya prolifera JEL478]
MSAPEGVRPTPPSQRTVILISLDGFRAEYLSRGLTPNLQALVASGVRAPYMLPSFPTETFPNHYTLVTGLYPARHGIVANEFYDPDAKRTFSYVNASDNKEEMWWEGGEPIWIAAERGGLRSACIMWPVGSEAPHKGRVPSYIVPYQSHVSVASKAEIVLGWLALDPPKRPSLITLYVPEVDSMGHTVGPDDALLNTTLVEVDGELGKLFDAVDQRGYGDRVDTVIVSDHGMASTSLDRVIYLSDFVKIDPSWIIRLNPLLFLYPPDESTLRQLHTALTNASKSTDPPLFSVWLRDEIPFPFHYRNNSRIPPLLLAPRVGWLFGTSRDEHEHGGWFPLGMHGYTNEDDRMRAIFLAKGPRFRKGAVVEPFANVDVYGLVAGLLGIEGIVPPNNSTDWRKVFGDVVLLD